MDILPSNRECTVMIVGYYGYGNLGDEAILEVLIKDIKEVNSQIQIVVPSIKPENIKERHEVHPIQLISWNMIRSIIKADLIIIGGGGLFSSDSGFFTYFVPLLAILGKILRKKVSYYAIGIYSTTPPLLLKLTKFSLKFADVISVRDTASLKVIRNELKRKILLVPDPALRLPFIGREIALKILQRNGIDTNKFLIGLSLRSMNEEIDDKLAKEVAKTVNWILDALDAIVIFYTFCPQSDYTIDDREIAKAIKKMIKHQDRFKILEYYPPSVTKGLIGVMDYFIGMRLHSMIFAHSMNVPFIGIIYEEKCKSFLRMFAKTQSRVYLSNIKQLQNIVKSDVLRIMREGTLNKASKFSRLKVRE